MTKPKTPPAAAKKAAAKTTKKTAPAASPAPSAAKAEPTALPQMLQIPIAAIVPHPDNPRHFLPADADDPRLVELAESIKAVGLLEPVLVRVRPLDDPGDRADGHFQLVAGERRWRACRLAGLEMIPAILRVLDDVQVLEVLVTENLQREDLAPLEEARGIKTLIDGAGWKLADVAERLGRSLAWVAARARLNTLSPAWRALLDDPASFASQWPPSHLLLVTRLEPEAQDELLEELSRYNPLHMDKQSVTHHIAQRARKLKQAPWKLSDGALEPTAGPCTSCHKRSSANPGLFDEESSDRSAAKDRCLDSTCWGRKLQRHLEARAAELRESHGTVVEVVGYSYRGTHTGALQRHLVTECHKDAAGAVPCVVIDGEDAGREYWGLPRASRSSGSSGDRPRDPQTGKVVPRTMAERREDLRRRRIVLAVRSIAEDAEESTVPGGILQLHAIAAIFGTSHKFEHRGGFAAWAVPESARREVTGPFVWNLLESMMETPGTLLETLWRKQLLPVLISRLEYFSGCVIEELWSEACGLASFLGIDADRALATSTAELKEPKSWAGLNEDGTPRSVTSEPRAEKLPAAAPLGAILSEHQTPFAYFDDGNGTGVELILFVTRAGDGSDQWSTYGSDPDSHITRLDNPALPTRATAEQAQADLDCYARDEGLEVCCRACGCTEDNACETEDGSPCTWVRPSLCSACSCQTPEEAANASDQV